MRKIAICLTAALTLVVMSGNSQQKTKVKTKTSTEKKLPTQKVLLKMLPVMASAAVPMSIFY